MPFAAALVSMSTPVLMFEQLRWSSGLCFSEAPRSSNFPTSDSKVDIVYAARYALGAVGFGQL